MVEVGGSVPNAGRKVEEMSCFSGWQAPGFAYLYYNCIALRQDFPYSGWTEAPPFVFDTYRSAFGGVAGSGTTSEGAREMLAGAPVSDGGGGPVLLGGPCSTLASLLMLDACGRSGSSEAR